MLGEVKETPETSRISPTAHYTSYVWYRNGLSHPALATSTGALLSLPGRAVDAASAAFGGPRTEAMLLSRHELIDGILERAIASGAVGQVVEVAAGLSPRGLRFSRRFPELRYVEGDLRGMCAKKRERLGRAGLSRPNHHVVPMNALADIGEDAIGRVATELLSPDEGVAIVTEGLLPYFDRDAVLAMWQRFSRVLRGYPAGLYVTELYARDPIARVPGSSFALGAISAVARGRVHLHFARAEDALTAAQGAGFGEVRIADKRDLAARARGSIGRGAGLTRVLEAWVDDAAQA